MKVGKSVVWKPLKMLERGNIMTLRSDIESLDAEIQALEAQIDQTSGMSQVARINEQICAKKTEMQRLLFSEGRATPTDIREQLDRLDQEIDVLEREVSQVTDQWIRQGGDSQIKIQRLTSLKLQKQRLLGPIPREVVQ
jgi:hypothetical protein